MATMIERKMASEQKELEKLEARLERERKTFEKKRAEAEKVGAAWSDEEWFKVRDAGEYTQKQYEKHFAMYSAGNSVKYTEERIRKAHARIDKLSGKVEEVEAKREEEERIAGLEKKVFEKEEAMGLVAYERSIEEFKAECAKDGVMVDEVSHQFMNGETKGGKHFAMFLNNGYTMRSFYCYTLYIDGEVVFTSGDFTTCYKYIAR